MLQTIRDAIHLFFYRRVDTILDVIATAARRVEKLGTLLDGEIAALDARLANKVTESEKARRVAAKLQELIS